jgi:hypothetical protein
MHMNPGAATGASFAQPVDPSSARVSSAASNGDRTLAAEDAGSLPAHLAAAIAENHELRAEIERLRSERSRMADVQTRLMEVLGCKSPDRLVHDVRNVLNDRELYRALADTIPG